MINFKKGVMNVNNLEIGRPEPYQSAISHCGYHSNFKRQTKRFDLDIKRHNNVKHKVIQRIDTDVKWMIVWFVR